MNPDWKRIRAEFPALSRWTYLNTATLGQLPERATRAVAGHFSHRDEHACTDLLSWFDDADRLRTAIARLIRAEASDIAFVPNASVALALLVGGIEWRPGDRVVTLENEFPNNIYGTLCLKQRGVEWVETTWENLPAALGGRTRLLALSQANYTTGFRPPLAELAATLHERGALLYVDGTQALGALRLDAGEVQPDMLAVHGYKWLLSPTGAGFMYVRPQVREWLKPAVIGWRSDRGWRDLNNLNHGAPEFAASAERYEGGMLPFPTLYGMEASIGLLLEIGPEAIERRVHDLAGQVRAAMRRLGAQLPGGDSPLFDSPIVAARFDGRDDSALVAALKACGVIISARHGCLRISPHFYNHEEDIARLEKELGNLL